MIKIIENYSDGNTWYRKYSNGWIEQGGKVMHTFATDETTTLTFPRPFTAAPLSISTVFIAPRVSDGYGAELGVKSGTVSATSVNLICDNYGTNRIGYEWEAKGF